MKKLVLCRMETDIVVRVDEHASESEIERLAVRSAREEVSGCGMYAMHVASSAEIKSVAELPEDWRNSIPYDDDATSDDRTCAEILKGTP
jgi:hypothetical protein